MIRAALGVATLLVSADFTSAQCQYSVQPGPAAHECMWGTLSGYSARGMNNSGAWCGFRRQCYPEEGEEGMLPVVCAPGGTPQLLPWPPGTGEDGAEATAVNDAGVVVGYFYTSTGIQKGCIWWPDGTVTEIPHALGASSCAPYDVNVAGVVVGASGSLPFIWDQETLAMIPLPPPGFGIATSVSESGYVSGTIGVSSQPTGRGFRWKDRSLDVLLPLAGHISSTARAVSNAGFVVGASTVYQPGLGYRHTPTIWHDNDPVALPLPRGYTSGGCYEINDAGLIVGFAQPGWSSAGGTVHVAWINGVPYVLNDLLAPGSLSIGSVVDLNNFGQILTGSARLATPTGQSIADLNGDCAVDGSDLVVVLSEWGPREWSVADINTDGVVDGNDLVVVLGHWTGS